MIKNTLYFSNPYRLSTRLEQIVIADPKTGQETTRPIEDLGFVVLEHPQISISYPLVQKLVANKVMLIFCDQKHLPNSLLLPLVGNTLQTERFRRQANLSVPTKKAWWQQTIKAKIYNQALLLKKHDLDATPLHRWRKQVKSGDPDNLEAKAARYYWQHLFEGLVESFTRDRFGVPPNNLLNYGYAILRAATARALVGSGLLCTFGIHHRNRYNPFCLADDIMEPYRPFVDEIVLEIISGEMPPTELTKEHKARLLQIVTEDTKTNQGISPLMIALQKTTSSLVNGLERETKKLFYPTIIV